MIYVVKQNDTLESIALKYYGSESGSSVLWVINKGRLRSGTPSTIYPGEVVDIPNQWNTKVVTNDYTAQGEDSLEDVVVHVNGKHFGGWLSVSISRSLETVSGSFSLSMTDIWESNQIPFEISDGDSVQVTIGGQLVITGYVDEHEMAIDENSHTFTIAGRDKTGDIVDCAVLNRPGEWRNRSIIDIARAMCAPYDITVTSDVDTGSTVDLFRADPGETVFSALEKLARGKELLVSGSDDGNVLLTRSSKIHLGTNIEEGVNALKVSFKSDSKDRFSTYIVEGQSDGSNNTKHSFRGTGYDPAVKRLRTTIIMAETKADQAYANRRAMWEARVKAANAQTVECTVQGWHTNSNELWAVNRLVRVVSSTLRIDDDLLITDITFNKSDSGTTTDLVLKRKDVYLTESELKEAEDILNAMKLAKKAKKKKSKLRKGKKNKLDIIQQINNMVK